MEGVQDKVKGYSPQIFVLSIWILERFITVYFILMGQLVINLSS